MKNVILLFSFLVFLNSCNQPKLKDLNFQNSTINENIKYRMDTIEKHFESEDTIERETYVQYIYPVFEGNEKEIDLYLNQVNNNQLMHRISYNDSSLAPIDTVIAEFFHDFKSELAERGDFKIPYAYELFIEPNYDSKDVIGMSISNYIFTGGAHPNHFVYNEYYDKRSKKKINNADLIDLKHPQLLAIADSQFRIQNELPLNESYSSLGYFWEADSFQEGEFRLNDNFSLDQDSITWIYNSYEIAAYAVGRPSFTMSRKAVEPFWKIK